MLLLPWLFVALVIPIVTWRSLMLLLQVLYHKSWNIVESDVKHNKTKQYKTKQTKPEDIKTVVYFIKQ